MGWFDGFTVASLGALAPAWPGMREQLEKTLLRKREEELGLVAEDAEDEDGNNDDE